MKRRFRPMFSSVLVLLFAVLMGIGLDSQNPAGADGLDPFCDATAAPGAAVAPSTISRPSFAGARLLTAGRDDTGRDRSETTVPTLLNLPLPYPLTGGSSHWTENRRTFAITSGSAPDFSFNFGLRTSTAPGAGGASSGLLGSNPVQELFNENFGLANDAFFNRHVGGVGLSLFVYHPVTAPNHQIAGDFGADVSVSDGTTVTHYRVTIGIDARPSVVGPGGLFPEASMVTLVFKRNTNPSRPERGWWGVSEELSYRNYPGVTDANRPPVKLSVKAQEVAVTSASTTVTDTLDSTQLWSKAPQDFAVGVSDQCTARARGTDPQTSRLTWIRPSGPDDATVNITARSGIGRGVRGLDGVHADITAQGIPRTVDIRFRQRYVSIDRSPDVVPRLVLGRIQSAALPPAGLPPEDPTVASGEIVGLPEHSVVVANNTALDKVEVLTCPTGGDLTRLTAAYGLAVTAPECSTGSPQAAERARIAITNFTPEEMTAAGPVQDAVAGLAALPTDTSPHIAYQQRVTRVGDPAGTPTVSRIGAQLEHVRRVVVDRGGAPAGGTRLVGWVETDGAPAASVPVRLTIDTDDRTDLDPTRADGSRLRIDGLVTSLPQSAKFEATTDPRGGTPFHLRWEAATPVHAEANIHYESGRRTPDDVDDVTGRFVTGPDGDIPRILEVTYRELSGEGTLLVQGDTPIHARARLLLSTYAERSHARARLVRVDTKTDHLAVRWRASERSGIEEVHAEACEPCSDRAPTRTSVAYITGPADRLGPTPTPTSDSVDSLPEPLDVPAELTNGPNPAFTPQPPLVGADEGVRAVVLQTKHGTDSDIRASIPGVKRFDLDRRPAAGMPSGDRDIRTCLMTSPSGRPFRVGAYVESYDPADGDSKTAVHVDAALSPMPPVLGVVLAESRWATTRRTDAHLLRFGTDGCDPATWSYGDRPDAPEGRPTLEAAVRSGIIDTAGIELLRNAAPVRGRSAARRNGFDGVIALAQDNVTLDLVGRLALPRVFELRLPVLDSCSAANAGTRPEYGGPCHEPVQERRDRDQLELEWGSTLRTFGGLDALVRQVGPDGRLDRGRWVSGTVADTSVSIAKVPGSGRLRADLSDNLRVPWQELIVELWSMSKYRSEPAVALDRGTIAYMDYLQPGYLGPWKATRGEYDPRNLVPNYRANLTNLGDRLRVTASLATPENGPDDVGPVDPRDDGRGWCASEGAVPDARRQSGVSYLHADVDMRGAPELTARVRRTDDPTDDRSADTMIELQAAGPIEATVRAKASIAQYMHSDEMAWLPFLFTPIPLGTVEMGGCVDVDLPLEARMRDVSRVSLFQSGMAVKADLPWLEAIFAQLAGVDPLAGTVGEQFFVTGSDAARTEAGAWFRAFRTYVDPPGWGEWDANATEASACFLVFPHCDTTTGLGRTVPGLPGVWRDVTFRPIAPVPGTADDCGTNDHWTNECRLPLGEINPVANAMVNRFGFLPVFATDLRTPGIPWELHSLADVLFDNTTILQMAVTSVSGFGPNVGASALEGLRRMSEIDGILPQPPLLLRDVPRPTTTFGATQTICGDWRHRGPGTTINGTRPVLADGTTLEAYFEDECHANTLIEVLFNMSRWTVSPSMQLVARFPDGSIRWTRTLVANGEYYEHETEAIWIWQGVYDNPPDDRTESVRIAVDPDGLGAQVQAFVVDDEDVELDRVFRFDASGAGGPVRPDRRLGVDTSVPFWRVTADPSRIVGVGNHEPSSVSITETLPACTPPACTRTLFFGDGTYERRDGAEGRPGPTVAELRHTWHGPGTYLALVVTYDGAGRATDTLPIRIRVS
ncbi:MAG: hypothetical protein IT198_05940 [Acidimicrobiia bacterium]|nr:hypothetical protein [Acidimicrobiia bacterium]